VVTDCAAARFRVWCLLVVQAAAAGAARGARVRTGSDRAGMVSFRSAGVGCGWSGGCWQGAEPLPARQECLLPWPVRADLEDALPGVVHEAGREVPDPVAQRVRLGFLEVGAVVEAQQPVPGGQVSGDVGGQDPAAVDLPGFVDYL